MSAIWLGLGFGLLQLLAGIVIRRSLARRAGRDPCAAEASQLHRLAQHVHGLIRNVHGQVDEHQTEFQRIRRELPSNPDDGGGMAASIFRSVSQVIQVNERLQDQLFRAEQDIECKERQIANHMAEARTDALTSLPNRRAFDDAMRQQAALHGRNGTGYGLIHIDVDHFKRLNDRWGHPAGDEVLKSVASAIRIAARETDLVARIGGEEFAVLLPSASASVAAMVGERLRQAIARCVIPHDGGDIRVTASIGLATVTNLDDILPERLTDMADQQLYEAKLSGRNCVRGIGANVIDM